MVDLTSKWRPAYDFPRLMFFYSIMVRAQMLSELEEIIAYKQYADQPERQEMMKKTWMKRYMIFETCCTSSVHAIFRLQGCQPDVDVWQRILQVRALVLSPDDDPAMWIKFANLCRKSERMVLAEKTINSLLSPERVCIEFLVWSLSASFIIINQHHNKAPPHVVYAHLKFMWAAGAQMESLEYLRNFTASLRQDLDSEAPEHLNNPATKQKMDELTHLLARCCYKQGEWQMSVKQEWNSVRIKISLDLKRLELIFYCREISRRSYVRTS